MSASKEINFNKLGIIAGGGDLPACLLSKCREKNIEAFVIGFKGQTDPEIMSEHVHLLTSLGSAGKIINFFKSNGVINLVLIGGIKRPSLKEINPDLKAVQILSRIGLKALGDNGLLTALRGELEKEGFNLLGIHDFCDSLLVSEGSVGIFEPTQEQNVDIELGLKVSQEIGALDIGQSIIVQNGMIVGVEAVEGTDALIERCGPLQHGGRGGILVKTCKPQQDKNLDLPTIGVETILNAHKAGLSGIVVQAQNTIIIDSKTVAKYADKYKMFVTAVSIVNDKRKNRV